MVSNFSVIPIHWVLTVNSEMAFFLAINSLRVCLFSFFLVPFNKNNIIIIIIIIIIIFIQGAFSH